MMGGQEEARRAVVSTLRVHANQVMLGRRDHIELSHLDAIRVVDLVEELERRVNELAMQNEAGWQRANIFEAWIENNSGTPSTILAEAVEPEPNQ